MLSGINSAGTSWAIASSRSILSCSANLSWYSGAFTTKLSAVPLMAKNSKKKVKPTVEKRIRKDRKLGIPLRCIQDNGGKQIIAKKEANKKGVMMWLMAFSPPMMITTAARPKSHNQEREILTVISIEGAQK